MCVSIVCFSVDILCHLCFKKYACSKYFWILAFFKYFLIFLIFCLKLVYFLQFLKLISLTHTFNFFSSLIGFDILSKSFRLLTYFIDGWIFLFVWKLRWKDQKVNILIGWSIEFFSFKFLFLFIYLYFKSNKVVFYAMVLSREKQRGKFSISVSCPLRAKRLFKCF